MVIKVGTIVKYRHNYGVVMSLASSDTVYLRMLFKDLDVNFNHVGIMHSHWTVKRSNLTEVSP